MLKKFQKVLVCFLIVIILFQFIFNTNISRAANQSTMTPKMINEIANLAGGVVSIVYWPQRIQVVVIAFVIDQLLYNAAKSESFTATATNTGGAIDSITPYDIFFNQIQLIDVNFFDLNSISEGQNPITYTIRSNVAMWFYAMRLIASIALLVILVYVGIRMAISTVARRKSKIQKNVIRLGSKFNFDFFTPIYWDFYNNI